MSACSLLDFNQPLYHECLRCIASIHSYVVNEGKFDLTIWMPLESDMNMCMNKTPV